ARSGRTPQRTQSVFTCRRGGSASRTGVTSEHQPRGRTPDRRHGPQQEVDAYGRISRLQFRNAGLTGANQLSQSALRQLAADAKRTQAASQGELHLDERSFLLVEPEKFSGRANFPSGRFKTSLFRAVHGTDPPIYSSRLS